MKPLSILLAAPHRAAFLPGLSAAALLLLWWALALGLRLVGAGPVLAVPALFAHGFLMLFGIFPFFMTGFLLTAGPRWLSVAAPSRLGYAAPPVLMFAGIVLWLAGLYVGRGWLLLATACYGMGFALLLTIFARLIYRSRAPERRHAICVLVALLLGLLALVCACLWLASGDARYWLALRSLALWGFLLPVFLTVSHRMIPFFTANVLPQRPAWRPFWLLGLWLVASMAHGALSLASVPVWPLDAALALLFAYTSVCWGLAASCANRLLAMLHLAFAWLAITFALYALQGVLQALGFAGALGLAPLHALTTGFFFTMLLAFGSRVMLGHSGHALQCPPALWRLFALANFAALSRVVGAMLPAAALPWGWAASAVLWLLVFVVWGRRFAPLMLKPRLDGKAG